MLCVLTINVETEVCLFATYRAGRRVQVPQLVVGLCPFPRDDFRAGLVARLTHVQNQPVELARDHEVFAMMRHDQSVGGAEMVVCVESGQGALISLGQVTRRGDT